jgi:hypothetical protein
MAIERAPASPLAQHFRPAGGRPYRVKNGDSWDRVARAAGVPVGQLIEFNFQTRNPAQVNWYLRRNVGCRKTTADGKNYIFSGDANPGVIYIPPRAPNINYTVPGIFDIVAQPSKMTCWAATATMMMSWRDKQSYLIQSAMDKCGTNWGSMFSKGQGLSAGDHASFAKAAGMTYEQLQCFPVEAWDQMLRADGPLAVVTSGPYHARILVGIRGDGTDANTNIELIDPDGGRRYWLNFGVFNQAFEGVAASPRFQLWHF